MSLLPLFTSVEQSSLGAAIRDSLWLFPAIEAIHLLGLALLGGAVLIVDLALLGLLWRSEPLAPTARDAEPWLVAALLTMLATGVPLFASEAIKCYYSPAFWVKMASLTLALLFTFTVRRKVSFAQHLAGSRSLSARLVGAVSIALWSGVGIGGRWIGFS
jgi:hypothetical protein